MAPLESTPPTRRRRTSARATHSLEKVVTTAIAMLDRDGIKGLTLRGLAAELGGGLGSVYWYVDGKEELLSLACDTLVGEALVRAAEPSGGQLPEDLRVDDPAIAAAVADLRRTALALFELAAEHRWLATRLHTQGAATDNAIRFWNRLGSALAAMGLTTRQQFHGSTAIIGYIVGVAAEMAAQDVHADPTRSKEEQLDAIAQAWLARDPADFGWIQSIADEFRDHDDDEQFVAGLDLIIGGLVRQALEQRG
ncbi:TetR family transcriptional regulator [Nocardioides phosphati]|uniref:TetR family transcriptional regulator n=1 Tax=Nocardioides phosphati TaxID=1867775 RepID=A0ABQ2NBP0_9ACTN|nr:TetR/AcrR family transcriptional regulator C-terminal domain-containing protein [Nocardioides phosphati]GGO88791.1 TetR family transcriptional regulator [Nocardioides phosphati]